MDAREKVNDIESSISRLLLSQGRPTPRLSNKAEQEEHHARNKQMGGGIVSTGWLEDLGEEQDGNRVHKV